MDSSIISPSKISNPQNYKVPTLQPLQDFKVSDYWDSEKNGCYLNGFEYPFDYVCNYEDPKLKLIGLRSHGHFH